MPNAGDNGWLPLPTEPGLDVVARTKFGLRRGRRRRFRPLGVEASRPRHEHVLVRQERDEVRVRHLRRARGHAEPGPQLAPELHDRVDRRAGRVATDNFVHRHLQAAPSGLRQQLLGPGLDPRQGFPLLGVQAPLLGDLSGIE